MRLALEQAAMRQGRTYRASKTIGFISYGRRSYVRHVAGERNKLIKLHAVPSQRKVLSIVELS